MNPSYLQQPGLEQEDGGRGKAVRCGRYKAYAKLDHDLMAGPAALAPYINTNARIFMSKRVGCYVYSQTYGSILNAACVS